jgi:hypothetical protein
MTHAAEIADFGDTTSTESAFFVQLDHFRIARHAEMIAIDSP